MSKSLTQKAYHANEWIDFGWPRLRFVNRNTYPLEFPNRWGALLETIPHFWVVSLPNSMHEFHDEESAKTFLRYIANRIIVGDPDASDYQPGDSVIWKQQHQGGYGYTRDVPATVVKVTLKRVHILVTRNNGDPDTIIVSPTHLRHTQRKLANHD